MQNSYSYCKGQIDTLRKEIENKDEIIRPIVGKSSFLNMAEFLNPSLKTSPCTATSPVSCKNKSFFLSFRNVVTFIKIRFVFLYYFLSNDEVLLSSLLDVSYHYLVFMDQVNGCSKSKLLVKEQVSLKSKIRFDCVCLL